MSENEQKEITVNPELEKAVHDAVDSEGIRSAVLAAAEKQGIFRGDKVKNPVAASEAVDDASVFTRTEIINGKEFTFEGGSELEVARLVNNAYKVASAVSQPAPVVEAPKVDPAQAQIDKVELELQFKRGEIDADTYLEKSGAVASYLEKQGASIKELKEVVEEKRARSYTASWEDATKVFLSEPTNDWPGGPRNLELIGLKLAALNLVDAPDKVAALHQAYDALKKDQMLFPVDAPADKATTDAPVAGKQEAPKAAAAAATVVTSKKKATSSSLFGASSGTASMGTGADKPKDSKVEIPKDATPAEIMEAWKQEVIRQGGNPNDQFAQHFSGKA